MFAELKHYDAESVKIRGLVQIVVAIKGHSGFIFNTQTGLQG